MQFHTTRCSKYSKRKHIYTDR